MEIYNNVGYDLLHQDPNNRKLEDLPKVKIRKNGEGHIEFANMKSFQVSNEEDMLNLLFVGDTNRVVCQTPLNDVSTRSHCVFMISSRQVNSSREQNSGKQRENCKQVEPGRLVRIGARIKNASRRASSKRGVLYQPFVALPGIGDHEAEQAKTRRRQFRAL